MSLVPARHLPPGRHRPAAGMTIIEVMLAVLVFGMLLAAVASSWFTLRSVQRLARDEHRAHEIAQALSERIVGANWDWIGRDRPDELKPVTVTDADGNSSTKDVIERYWRHYAWSWHRRETPGRSTQTRLPPMGDRDWSAEDLARFEKEDLLVGGHAPVASAKEFNPHNLIDTGVLEAPTGMPNLQVYVEYYHAELLDQLFVQPLADRSAVTFWQEVVKDRRNPALLFPESPFASDAPDQQMNPADQALAMKAMVVRIIVTWGETPKLHRHEVVMARRK